jgi:thioredoxin-related protein
VIVQEKRELAGLVKAQWTPTALFVNADGRIGSYVSAGDKAIRELVDDIKSRDLDSKFVFVVNTNGASQSLLIGESVPEFTLSGANGEPITRDAVNGRKTLAVFWSMTCPHCVNMKEAILEWEGVRGVDDPDLILFSNGEPDENRELGFKSPVVHDKSYEVAKKIGMAGTPSAVLIDENGQIASSTASGAEKVWALIGRKS